MDFAIRQEMLFEPRYFLQSINFGKQRMTNPQIVRGIGPSLRFLPVFTHFQ
jgi:hypothetical protein